MDKILSYIFISLAIYIGIKGLFLNPIDIDNYVVFEMVKETGRKNKGVITPGREMYYVKEINDTLFDVGIYKIKGKSATKYFPGIYCIGRFPLGLRYFKNPESVFDAELILLKKDGDSLPELNDSFKQKIVFYEDKVIIGKYVYDRIPLTKHTKDEAIFFMREINKFL